MAETKVIFSILANVLGFGVYFIGIVEFGEGWRQNILFALGVIFMTIKVGTGILDLIKKKYNSTRILSMREIEYEN